MCQNCYSLYSFDNLLVTQNFIDQLSFLGD